MPKYKFDVALSFAGAQRGYVRDVALELQAWGVRAFYDENFDVEMWGEDINEYLQQIYERNARFVVMFVSAEYKARAFPTGERRAAFAGAMHGGSTVLPVRFDDTELPGLQPNIAYLPADSLTSKQLAAKLVRKLEIAGVALRRPTSATLIPVPRPAHVSEFDLDLADPNGERLAGAEVAMVGENGTVVQLSEVSTGLYHGTPPAGRLMKLWVAHPDHPSVIRTDISTEENARATVGVVEGVGSKLMGRTGYLPSINGRLNPILDSHGRTSVYIDNAAANGRPAAPFLFSLRTPFEVEDSDGSITVVTIMDISGHGSLLEYRAP